MVCQPSEQGERQTKPPPRPRPWFPGRTAGGLLGAIPPPQLAASSVSGFTLTTLFPYWFSLALGQFFQRFVCFYVAPVEQAASGTEG